MVIDQVCKPLLHPEGTYAMLLTGITACRAASLFSHMGFFMTSSGTKKSSLYGGGFWISSSSGISGASGVPCLKCIVSLAKVASGRQPKAIVIVYSVKPGGSGTCL